jgi:HEAT repeat protein
MNSDHAGPCSTPKTIGTPQRSAPSCRTPRRSVRAAAALAFASVQDSTARPCLIEALSDANTMVRINAAFGLGMVADSATLIRVEQAAADR